MIRLRDIHKEYQNGTKALKGVSMQIDDGDFVFLVGPSGSGKSTIIKLITAEISPTRGKLMVNGYNLNDISEKQIPLMRRTIGVVFQDFRLIEKKTVYENIEVAMRAVGATTYEIRRRIPYVLDLVGLTNKGGRLPTQLSGGEQQRVAIARALAMKPDILCFDEPTSALSQSEVKVLFKVIAQLKRRGVTIIYISHRLEELMEIGDNITIFRDGRFISERHVSDASVPWIIEQMVGDKKKHFDYQPAPKGDAVLDVKGLTALHPSGGYKLNDVTFTLSKGEVIGIYGLLGAGRTELFKGLVGLMPCQRGEVHLNGESIGKSRFQQRLKKGLALVPEDRQGEGVVQMMSIQANMTLSDFSLQGFRRAWRWLNPQKEESCVKEMIQQLAIKVSDATLPITSLSGGNQQKVVLGKALMTQPQVVFLDEPTRGIDVGAKTDVYHLIGKMAQQGLAVMFSSSELDEVMALADRILVMADGRITADLPRHAVTREQLIAASTPQD